MSRCSRLPRMGAFTRPSGQKGRARPPRMHARVHALARARACPSMPQHARMHACTGREPGHACNMHATRMARARARAQGRARARACMHACTILKLGPPSLVRREFPFLNRKSQFRSLYLGGPHPPIQHIHRTGTHGHACALMRAHARSFFQSEVCNISLFF